MSGPVGDKALDDRYQVLEYDQVRRLMEVMEGEIPICSRSPECPTIHLTLKELVRSVRRRLEESGIEVRDVRLNGGAACYIIDSEASTSFSDIDLLFGVDLSNSCRTTAIIKDAVLEALITFLPTYDETSSDSNSNIQTPSTPPILALCTSRESYIEKQARINSPDSSDRWSLITLGHSSTAKSVELKFVDQMRRQFEFTVDSFHINLDSLLTFFELSQGQTISEHFYPTVNAHSVSGRYSEALYHLQNRLIATRNPEEIRGGGLLKYCKLLVDGYTPSESVDTRTMERYMCSRFFIDFPDIRSQQYKLESYLSSHFITDDSSKVSFLGVLGFVIANSTICLMGHERREALDLVWRLRAHEIIYSEQRHPVIQLEMFNSKNWQIDQISFGTSHFPPLAYLGSLSYGSCYSTPSLTSSMSSLSSSPSTPSSLSPSEASSSNLMLL